MSIRRLGRVGLRYVSVVAAFSVWLAVPGLAAADEVYTVQSGDILGEIAESFGCSVEDIRGWNDLDDDMIRIGQELVIRSSGRSRSGTSGYQTYTVGSGDTLSGIASQFGVTVDEIVGWNSGLDPDRIRIGQELRIRSSGRQSRTVEYEVQSGDFVGRIAANHDVTIDDLVRWNSGLDPDRIRIGQIIRIMVEGPEVASESIGRANEGRLVNGEMLPEHRAFNIRDEDRAWGTNETVSAILDAFDHMMRRHPDAPILMVHDLSDEDGGSLRGHRSHQSGRDADIGYYHDGCGDICPYEEFDEDEIDHELNWTLLSYWIDNDLIEYVFIDYDYQEELYEWLQEQGESERNLNQWFQYPHGRDAARGLIRHERNHEDHMHVRFGCPGDDDRCR